MQYLGQIIEFAKVLPVSNYRHFSTTHMRLNDTLLASGKDDRTHWSQFVPLCLSLG